MRYFYSDRIEEFLRCSTDEILGRLSKESSFDINTLQRNAWVDEINLLKNALVGENTGEIIFEYSIPRLGKRIDTVLLLKGLVFVLEFKIGATEYLRQDIEQVWDYALDLKNFHEASHPLTIVPILIATDAKLCSGTYTFSYYNDHVFEPICCNAKGMTDTISNLCTQYGQVRDLTGWKESRYLPTPTIIQAARALYGNHSVENITRTEASGKSLKRTSAFVLKIIDEARSKRQKSICFITGVPGAGKTLVGLNIATKKSEPNTEQGEPKELAVYLSGNRPLVDVLSEALARDKVQQEKEAYEQGKRAKKPTKTEAKKAVNSFIQIVHHYRDTTLSKLRPIHDGSIEIDPNKTSRHEKDGYAEVEHVAIFDEAQRAWTQPHLSNWLKRKKHIANFPMSEPEFLIWSLDLREDWAVIVCLVGGGQEINSGEAGIAEWIRAINLRFPNWNVYISDKLTGKEYANDDITPLLARNPKIQYNSDLHLAVSMRSFRAERLATFVHLLLEGNVTKAKELFSTLNDKFPLVLTRSLDTAKKWLRQRARGTERYGLVVSSQAQRLRPLAIDVRCKPDTVHWFLDDITDIRSSLFLEDAASEFDVQGLELDWTCLIWDGDLRWQRTKIREGWGNYAFKGNKWENINTEERKAYQINAYRVLLTRARQGMILCIPEGNPEDATRLPEFYDGTYQYLKNIGIPEI